MNVRCMKPVNSVALQSFVHCISLSVMVILTMVLLGCGTSGNSQNPPEKTGWFAVNTGLNHASVRSLAIDPTNNNVIYAGTNGGGIYKSTDGGVTWHSKGHELSDAHSLAIDSTNSQVVYASAYGSIYKTTSGGDAWTEVYTGDWTSGFGSWVGAPIKISEIGDLTVNTFSVLDPGNRLAIESTNTQVIYAVTGTGKVIKSTDGGSSWVRSDSGMPTDACVYTLAIDSVNTQTIYAGTNGGMIYKSTNSGGIWSAVNTSLSLGVSIYSLAIDSVNPQTIYAGSSAGSVFKTSDGGLTWTDIYSDQLGGSVNVLTIDPANNQVIYAGTGSGSIFKSSNGGSGWMLFSSGLSGGTVSAIAIDPIDTDVIYAGELSASLFQLGAFVGVGDGGVFKSSDGGGSWALAVNGITNCYIQALAINPTNSQVIYAGGNNSIYRSTNGGVSWIAINSGMTSNFVNALAIDQNNTQVIYAGTGFDSGSFQGLLTSVVSSTSDGVYKTTDGGNTWAQCNTGLPQYTTINSLAIDPRNSQIIIAGGSGGIYKTTNGGDSWTEMIVNYGSSVENSTSPISLTINAIAISANSQIVYAVSSVGVFKSIDAGNSWAAINTGLTETNITVLSVDPSDSQVVFVGGASYGSVFGGVDGVFKSITGGNSWAATNNGLTSENIRSLVIDPKDSQTIYAGTFEGGIFKSTTGGNTWSAVNSGLTYPGITSLAIDPSNSQVLYAGTFYGGVFKTFTGGL